jgi:branched-chain amino acid transport system substrate-binding protein
MIGPQNGSIKAELGPVLNGLVNYEYWLPVPKMMYPGVSQLIAEYQSGTAAEGAGPLGCYVAPQAYAQMQIVEQAVTATGSLDDAKLAQFTRDQSFKTILGELKFGAGGGRSEARVLQVQYRNIKGNDLANFRHAETQAVVWPPSLASAALTISMQRHTKTAEAPATGTTFSAAYTCSQDTGDLAAHSRECG